MSYNAIKSLMFFYGQDFQPVKILQVDCNYIMYNKNKNNS